MATSCYEAVNLAEIKAEYMEMLQTSASLESIDEIGEFLDLHLGRFETTYADQMLIAFEDYVFAFDRYRPNYREFLERYGDYISSALASLYEIKAEEQENPAVIDNTLQMTWAELAGRALELELFIRKTNNLTVQEEAVDIFENYIRLMFMGVGDMPIFDSDGIFNENARSTYAEFDIFFPDTTVAEVLREYMYFLASIDFQIDFENIEETIAFSDMCSRLVLEAGKRVFR